MSKAPQRQSALSEKLRHAAAGPYIFLAVIVTLIISAVIGIEWLRRVDVPLSASNSQTATSVKNSLYPRTLRDGNGNTVVIEKRPERIVSQTLGTDEVLLAICAPTRLVAFSKFAFDPNYSNVVAEAQAAGSPVVQNAEEILGLDPDLIFVASYSRAETVEQLQTAGAPIFRFANFDRIDDIKENIRAVGYAIGEDERAAKLIEQMEQQLNEIQAKRIAPKDNQLPNNLSLPRVMSYGSAGFTAGANTLFDDIIRAAGATNVTAENGIDGFRKVSAEQVATWQPDFIVVGANTNEFEEVKHELLANPAIAATEAARRNRIVMIDTRYFLTVSHHVVRAVEVLANAFHSSVEAGD